MAPFKQDDLRACAPDVMLSTRYRITLARLPSDLVYGFALRRPLGAQRTPDGAYEQLIVMPPSSTKAANVTIPKMVPAANGSAHFLSLSFIDQHCHGRWGARK